MKARSDNLPTNVMVIGLLSLLPACAQSTSGPPASGGAQGGGGEGDMTGGSALSSGARATGGLGSSLGGGLGLGGSAAASGGAAGAGGAAGSGATTKSAGGSPESGGSAQLTGAGGGSPSGGYPGGASAAGSAGGGGHGLGGTIGGSAGSGVSPSGGASSTTSSGGTTGSPGGAGAGGTSGAGGTMAASACPTTALSSGNSTRKLTVGALSREYILHVPSAYKSGTPVPLLVDFHPIGGSDTEWSTASPYPAVVDAEGAISAYPNGEPSPNLGNAWDVEGCCTSPINGAAVDDVAFAKAVVADVEAVACIDVKRVYAVGFSMGGGMSNYLACHAADTFAAVGPASFDLTEQNEGDCKPTRPLTVIEWRGKQDSVVPYAGGYSDLVTGMAITFLGAVGTFQKWASLDGCTGNPGTADANNCQTYSQCSAAVQVTLCTDNNGGHEAANANIVWPMLKTYTMP